MKLVLALLSALVAVQRTTSQATTCSNVPTYNSTLEPVCDSQDLYIKWPNYENQYSYYSCASVGNPLLTNCPNRQIFVYVLQTCAACSSYIPPPPCSQLKTQNPPVCVPIGSSTPTPAPTPAPSPTPSGLPTPNYPPTTNTTTTTTTTLAPTTTTTSTPAPATNTTTTTLAPITPPVQTTTTPGVTTTTSSTIPPPPSQGTNAPGIPTPPTPDPTPETVDATPPQAS